MLRLTLRSARAHWRRFILTSASVVVGVAFVVGSFVLTDSLTASIDASLLSATSQTDLVVQSVDGRGLRPGGFGGRSQRPTIAADLAPVVAGVPGVRDTDVTVGGVAQLLDKGGQADRFDFAFVSNWPAHPEMSALALKQGRAPVGPNDVVIDTATAAERRLGIGDPVRIATRRGIIDARVRGLAERGGGNLGAAGSILAFTTERATELVGTTDRVDAISIRLADGADLDEVRRSVEALVQPGAMVFSADALLAQARARIDERLGDFTNLLLGFAAVTAFVSAFLIWNTFSMVVAQRTREMALLRAVGASRAQIAASVLGEGAVVATIASGLGIFVGVLVAVGLRQLIAQFGVDLPSSELVVAPRTVAVALLVGLGVTLVSVIGPARRSTKVPPIAALSAAAVPMERVRLRSGVLGWATIVLGIGLGARGVMTTSWPTGSRVQWVALGGVAFVLGLTVVAHRLAPRVIGVIGAPFARVGGVPSALARRNAVRDPRRTASTASALMIGLALVSTTLVLGESLKAAFGGALRRSISADVVVEAGGIAPFDEPTIAAIRSTEGVRRAVTLGEARVTVARPPGEDPAAADSEDRERGERFGISIADPTELARVLDPAFSDGEYPADDREIAIATSFADEEKFAIGDSVTITSDSGDRELRISGIYERDEVLDDALGRPGVIAGLAGIEAPIELVLVQTGASTGQTPAAVADRLATATAGIPNSSAQVTDDWVEAQTNALDIVLGIVDGLLLFAVIVAGMGIGNTLALSVVERTRELGLLRTVGMHRRAMRSMIRVEGVLIAMFGGVLGVGVGIAFGSAVAAALPVDAAQLTIPFNRLAGVLIAAGLLGIIAAAAPARRAARLAVLEAIRED